MSRASAKVLPAIPVPRSMIDAFLKANEDFPQLNTVIVPAIALAYLRLSHKPDLSSLIQMQPSSEDLDYIEEAVKPKHEERNLPHPKRERFVMLWNQQVQGVVELIASLWNAMGHQEISTYWLARHIGTLSQAPEGSLASVRNVLQPIQELKNSPEIFQQMEDIIETMIIAAYSEARTAGEHAGRVVGVAKEHRRSAPEERRFAVQMAAQEGGKAIRESIRQALAEKFPHLKSFF